MTLLRTSDEVAIWTHRNTPIRMVWHGERWRVSDTPTPLRGSIVHPAITHPLEPVIGWRFQATSDAGRSMVFDIRMTADRWEIVALYD